MSSTREKLPLFILCLYSVFSLSSMGGMNVAFLFVFLTFLFLLFKQSFKLPELLTKTQEFKRYVLFGGILFVACLLSLIVAKIFPISYANQHPDITVHGFLKIWYMLCPLILASVFLYSPHPRKLIEQAKTYWWAATLVLAVIAVIQFYTGWPIAQQIPTNPGHFHAVLFFGHHLSTASIVIFPAFVALAQFIGEYRRTKTISWFALITGLAGILILFLTYARAAWLSVPIGIVILFFRYLKPKEIGLSLLALLVVLGVAGQSSLVKDRITNSMGVTDRLRLWEANIDFFKQNPVTGIGWLKNAEMSEYYFQQKDPDHYHSYFWGHAHSNFFEMLGGTGMIGLLAFLAWSIFTFKLAFRASSPQQVNPDAPLADFAYGLGVALILLHINGLTNVTFWEGKVMHQQMFAIAWLLVIQALNHSPKPQV